MNLPSASQDDLPNATFKELDQQYDLVKGSAFRAFKDQLAHWTEGVEFVCCDSRTDAAAFAQLEQQQRLYPGTVNAVLIMPAGRPVLGAILEAQRSDSPIIGS